MLSGCGNVNSSINNLSSNISSSSTIIESTSSVISSSSKEQSPIESLTAIHDIVEFKLGEKPTLSNYYELKGYKSLSESQKEVTITSSNEKVVRIDSSNLFMMTESMGTADITVISKVDPTKMCMFTVNVVSPIESITAIYENVELVVGEQVELFNYYELNGYDMLLNEHKEVIITSSDENVVKVLFTSYSLYANDIGSADITITSKVDPTKTCTFTVNVVSPIKSLIALYENVELNVGEQLTLSKYYELVGYHSLSLKQKQVTITSSDETIVKISSGYKTMTAVNKGSAIITVTSDVDKTKVCTFTVNVKDVFFDRTMTSIISSWDVSHEMDAENPYIKVDTNLTDGIYVKNSDGLKWYIESEITIHSINNGEEWPKFGIVANTTMNTLKSNNNKIYFYLDAPMNRVGKWTNFGVCEVSNGGNWGWYENVKNNEARYNSVVTSINTPIGYETTFTMGMLRDGFDCHLYVNGTYMASIKALDTLLGNYDEVTSTYQPANCMAGLFSFNSTVTFSNYKFINDETELAEYMPSSPIFKENWAND